MSRPVVACALSLLVSLAPRLASAADDCSPVSGTVTTTFAPQGCTSPVGVCTVGTIAAGALTGTTTFTASSLVVRGPLEFFDGVFTVTTSDGVATYATAGVLDTRTGQFAEVFRLTSGTSELARAKSELFSTGSVSATGFSGSIQGSLCTR